MRRDISNCPLKPFPPLAILIRFYFIDLQVNIGLQCSHKITWRPLFDSASPIASESLTAILGASLTPYRFTPASNVTIVYESAHLMINFIRPVLQTYFSG